MPENFNKTMNYFSSGFKTWKPTGIIQMNCHHFKTEREWKPKIFSFRNHYQIIWEIHAPPWPKEGNETKIRVTGKDRKKENELT